MYAKKTERLAYRTECQEVCFEDYRDLRSATRAACALSIELGMPVRVIDNTSEVTRVITSMAGVCYRLDNAK